MVISNFFFLLLVLILIQPRSKNLNPNFQILILLPFQIVSHLNHPIMIQHLKLLMIKVLNKQNMFFNLTPFLFIQISFQLILFIFYYSYLLKNFILRIIFDNNSLVSNYAKEILMMIQLLKQYLHYFKQHYKILKSELSMINLLIFTITISIPFVSHEI